MLREIGPSIIFWLFIAGFILAIWLFKFIDKVRKYGLLKAIKRILNKSKL